MSDGSVIICTCLERRRNLHINANGFERLLTKCPLDFRLILLIVLVFCNYGTTYSFIHEKRVGHFFALSAMRGRPLKVCIPEHGILPKAGVIAGCSL